MRWITVIATAVALVLGFGLGRWSAPDPESELASVESFRQSLEDPDWLTRSYRFSSFLVGLNPENLPDALEALEPHLPWLLTDEFRMIMLAWSRFDAPGAFKHAQTWPPPISRNAAAAAMYAWGFRSPLEAARELETVENPELQEFWAARLLAGWVHGKYRDTASKYIAAMPESPSRFAYIGTLAWELSKDGPKTVMRWAEEVPEEPANFKHDVFLNAASTLAGIDPAATAHWLQGHLDHDYVDDALLLASRSWANHEPTAAMDWLIGLAEGEKRDAAVEGAFNLWLKKSPNQAMDWLRSASPARAVDPAVRILVRAMRERNPEVSKEWAARLSEGA
jgi:hypothetical protein